MRGGDKRRSRTLAIVLIGGPGQGKSTLGQLGCQLHRAGLLRPQESQLTSEVREILRPFQEIEGSAPKSEALVIPQKPLLPLKIVLPDAATWLSRESRMLSESHNPAALLRFLASQPAARKHALQAEDLDALLVKMPFLLFLDGFDEVGAAEDRAGIVNSARELLSEFAKRDASALIFATTRPQGYSGELAGIGYPIRETRLVPLQNNEALHYAQKLVDSKIQNVDEQAKTMRRLVEAAKDPATARLMTTPLQVSILAALVQQGRAPNERWKLFWSYFDFTYKREVERETYASALLQQYRTIVEKLHAQVALLLQVEAERAGSSASRMNRQRLQEIAQAVLQERGYEGEELDDLVRQILEAAERRLVFLVEPEPGSFGFEIRSLQEFMAAWALTDGRETCVEQRLLQIAKAPMFRNVALFVTSRFFSEGSVLRDLLADQICGALDNDPGDALARISKIGAMLALEALEEGAVFTDPKRARALMERAVGILELPPGPEHQRLAQVAQGATLTVLKGAIETRFQQAKEGATTYTLSAWITLIAATNQEQEWAKDLGDRFWPPTDAGDALLNACVPTQMYFGRWFGQKIESDSQRFSVEQIILCGSYTERLVDRRGRFFAAHIGYPGPLLPWGGRLIKRLSPKVIRNYRNIAYERRWTDVLAQMYDQSHLVSPCQMFGNELGVISVMAYDARNYHTDLKYPENEPPNHWRPWIATERFFRQPSAGHLSKALFEIGRMVAQKDWHLLMFRAPWPLVACLQSARDSDDLLRFAAICNRGELGDYEYWKEAEKTWQPDDPIGDFLRASRESMSITTSWNRTRLEWDSTSRRNSHGFPITTPLNRTRLEWDSTSRQNSHGLPITTPWNRTGIEWALPLAATSPFRPEYGWRIRDPGEHILEAAQLFSECKALLLRDRLAEICLSLYAARRNHGLDSLETSAFAPARLASLRTRLNPQVVNFETLQTWVDSTSNAEVYLFPKPMGLSQETWFKLLHRLPRRDGRYWIDIRSYVNAFLQDPSHPTLLFLARRCLAALRLHDRDVDQRLHDRDGDQTTLLHTLAAAVKQANATSPESKADMAILRIAVGQFDDQNLDGLLQDVFNIASRESDLWSALLQVASQEHLPNGTTEHILLKCYEVIDRSNPAYRDLIDAIQTLLETRRSNLEKKSNWDRLELPLPYPQSASAAFEAGTIPRVPIALRSLRLENVRGLQDVQLTFEAPAEGSGQWIVLLGPNGAGKTTILRSLALALRNVKNPALWPKGAFNIPWRRLGTSAEAKITIKTERDNGHVTTIRGYGSEKFFQNPELDGVCRFPLFAYGCRRGSALGGSARDVNLDDDDGPEVATLFDEGASLIHGETWLKELDGDAQRNDLSKSILAVVKVALCKLLQVQAIQIRDQMVWVEEWSGKEVPFKALSDGYLTSAGWFLDLIARYIHLLRKEKVPIRPDFLELLKGLVLLDEIDLHLHPRWQMEVINRTRELLPRMSFIVSTHNPLTLIGARAEEIHILAVNDGKISARPGVEMPMLLTAGQIFTHYFEIDSVMPHELGQKLQRYGFLSGYRLRTKAEQAEMERLRADLKKEGIEPGWEEVPQDLRPEQPPVEASPSRMIKGPAKKSAPRSRK